MKEQNYIQLDSISKIILFFVVLSSFLFINEFYLFSCAITIIGLFFLVQKPYNTGVFTLILVQHFLQIFATVLQAEYLNKDINYRSPETGISIIVSLIGLTFLFIPIIFYINKLPKFSLSFLHKHALSISTEKCLYTYLCFFFIASSLSAIAFNFGGLTQIILSIIKLKWLFFLLFGFLSIIKNEKRKLFYLFIGVEFILGFFSYFSEFKTVIYYCVILFATFLVTVNVKQIFFTTIVLTIMVAFAITWTIVKTDYRAFLNKGTSQQTVSVNRDDAMEKLYDLSSKQDANGTEVATNIFLDRLQYSYHFAKTIERVPSIIPFQNGQNLLEVLIFSTTPRFLNADKALLDNSVKASKYTGLQYAGLKKGVSFSLGYFAEFYLDFGFLGMMIPLFIIGIIYGNLYFYFITKGSPNILFNYAIVGSFFMEFYAFEMDATFFTGRFFASLITYLLMIWFVFPAIYSYIVVKKEND